MVATNRSRLIRRLLVLAVLAMGLVLSMGVANRNARATTCCSTCEPAYESCLIHECGCNPITLVCPPNDQVCINRCQLFFNECDINCDEGC
jgi:hypothetical protein